MNGLLRLRKTQRSWVNITEHRYLKNKLQKINTVFQENKNKFDVISAEERRENDSMSMKGMWEKKKEEGPKNTVFSS